MKTVIILIAIFLGLATMNFTVISRSKPDEKACDNCHSGILLHNQKHGAVLKNCEKCHLPSGKQHPGDEKGFSLAKDTPGLCNTCHEEMKELLDLKSVHPPFKMNCFICHSAHGRDESPLLKEKSTDLCIGCHDDVQADIEKQKYRHAALNEENSCIRCHNPHGSDNKKLLADKEKKVCLSCHNKSVSKDNKPVINMKEKLETSKFIHPALANGGCSPCHTAHGADRPHLLTDSYPEGNYAPARTDTFTLCFNCHDSDILEKETTTTATGFRNGDRNLHYVHLQQGSKGRSCIICHDVHASQNEHLVAGSVRFGTWKMPLEYTPKENGGSCATGCHAVRGYKR